MKQYDIRFRSHTSSEWIEEIYADSPEQAALAAEEYAQEDAHATNWACHEIIKGIEGWVTTEGKF